MNTKKILSIALALMLMLTLTLFLAACNGDEGNNSGNTTNDAPANGARNNSAVDGSAFGIDLTSTEVQQMSAERASAEKLKDVVWDWLGGGTMFIDGMHDEAKLTYGDFVDFIGVDATEYNFEPSSDARFYTWIAEESDASKFAAWFIERGGTWSLSMTGASNLNR